MTNNQTTHQVEIGTKAVWVHSGETGECLGRFGVYGIDVHRLVADQGLHGQCLDCTHGRTTDADWARFRKSMLVHHGVDLSDMAAPAFVKEQDT